MPKEHRKEPVGKVCPKCKNKKWIKPVEKIKGRFREKEGTEETRCPLCNKQGRP